jgi:hypothetical protein
MRKVLVLGLGVGLWLSWAVGAQAGGKDEARALIDKAIKAHGAKRLAKVKALQFKGTGKIHLDKEYAFTAEVFEQLPDKQKIVVELDFNGKNLTFTQVVNGKKGWKGITGMIQALGKEEVQEVKEQLNAEAVASLLPLKDKHYKLSLLGESKVGDHDTVGVQVTRKGFRDVNLYIDKKSHLLRKAEYRTVQDSKEVTQEKFFHKYKKVDGLQSPTKMVLKNDGNLFMEIEISETTLHENALDDSVFAKPE